MSDIDPYQPPRSESRVAKQHRLLATQFLKFHEHQGNFLIFIRVYAFWILLRALPAVPIIFLMMQFGMEDAIGPTVVLIAWSLFMDISYMKILSSSWGFYEKIVDWKKVGKLAEVEEI